MSTVTSLHAKQSTINNLIPLQAHVISLMLLIFGAVSGLYMFGSFCRSSTSHLDDRECRGEMFLIGVIAMVAFSPLWVRLIVALLETYYKSREELIR